MVALLFGGFVASVEASRRRGARGVLFRLRAMAAWVFRLFLKKEIAREPFPVQLRMRLEPKPGLGGRIAGRLGLHRDVRVDLDPCGTFFWSQIDGQQDLRTIEQKLREQFDLDPEESEKATIVFTKMLMLRHLVQLRIEE